MQISKKYAYVSINIKIYDGGNFENLYEVLSNKKLKKKLNKILIENYKDVYEYPDFGKDYWSRTAKGVFEIGHVSIRLKKWLIYYDGSHYDKLKYYDLMGSVLKYINEISNG